MFSRELELCNSTNFDKNMLVKIMVKILNLDSEDLQLIESYNFLLYHLFLNYS
jgi:hypothetical protein